jgi:hypothetical protein
MGLAGVGRGIVGAGEYTYSAARFYAVLWVVFFPLGWLLSRPRSTSLLWRHFRWLAVATLAAIIVFAPMGLHLATNSHLISHRADEVSFLNPRACYALSIKAQIL